MPKPTAAQKLIETKQAAARCQTDGKAYLTSQDVAVLIRARLKAAFPGVKFSVTSDYNSVDASWENGPMQWEIDAIIGQFSFGGFDGMIDMAYSTTNWLLPDGTMTPAASSGAEGSRGSVPAFTSDCPTPGAVLVTAPTKYVNGRRSTTEAFDAGRIAAAGEYWGFSVDPAKELWNQYHDGESLYCWANRYEARLRMGTAEQIASA